MKNTEIIFGLRNYALQFPFLGDLLTEAADTIESLSEKLRVRNIEKEKENIKRHLKAELCPTCGAPVGRGAKTCFECGAIMDWDLLEENIDTPEWITCDLETLPDKEVLCCDRYGEMIIGYVFEYETSGTGFSAENDFVCMYDCVKWMELPKA